MDAKIWKKRITEAAQQAGTYRPFFDDVITTLSTILQRRDEAEEIYQQQGGQPVVEHTNVAGVTNTEQNPVLRLINDLNRDALSYWRDLGLTPAGLRKIDEQAMKGRKKSSLAEVLEKYG